MPYTLLCSCCEIERDWRLITYLEVARSYERVNKQIRYWVDSSTSSVISEFNSPASLNFTGVFTQPPIKSEDFLSDVFQVTLVIQY